MMKHLAVALVAAALAVPGAQALAQSASTVGAKASNGRDTAGGTAGSAAAGGTSASTIGLGANSTGKTGSSSSIAGGGSAAAANGKASSNTRIRENPQMMRAQSKAQAHDGGTWSRSATDTRIKHDGDLSSRTKSMSHVPGGKPAMSTSRVR